MIHILLWSESGKLIEPADIAVLKKAYTEKTHLMWLDLDSPTEEELTLLKDIFHFHPLAIRAVRDLVNVPKIDLYENYLFLVLHRVFYHFETEKCELREFEIFFSDRFIVTIHQAHLARTFQTTREKLREHSLELGQHGTGYILFRLLSMAIEDYKPALEKWQDALDDIETCVFQKANDQVLEKIMEFKKLVAKMHRGLLPEREVFIELYENKDLSSISKGIRPYFKIVLDNMNVLMQELDGLRDHAATIFNMYTAMLTMRMTEASHKLNFVMQRLTIAASIFLPLTFIVGIYGMNFKFMPELTWKWGYFFVWGVMIVLTAGMAIFFKRKKWF